MSILRTTQSPPTSPLHASSRGPLRVFASGTLFITHRLSLSAYPAAGGVARAQNVQRNRGGHGANVLTTLAQFRPVRPHPSPSGGPVAIAFAGVGARVVGDLQFCGPLAGTEEGVLLVRELHGQRIGTVFSIVRDGKGVPAAWVLEAGDGTRTIINHNPLPDMTHDEFISRLGPVLAPENYDIPSSPPPHPVPTATSASSHLPPRNNSIPGHHIHGSPPGGNMQTPYHHFNTPGMPPFDWMHFEARAAQITLANIIGLNGLARERGWRTRCVFSLEIARTGVEALIPHVDVVFFSKPYAQSVSPSASPRSFLISMSVYAAPHALLVVDWGAQGAALLSVPTREYLQSSGWVEPACDVVKSRWNTDAMVGPASGAAGGEVVSSVRSGSGFWADGRPQSGFTLTGSEGSQWTGSTGPLAAGESAGPAPDGAPESEGESDSRRTSMETERGVSEAQVVDAVGAHEAFVAGMIFALSQRILPGHPYAREETPNARTQASPGAGRNGADVMPGGGGGGGGGGSGAGKWKLEDCLRFATELSGRKGRKKSFDSLRLEMEKAGWVVE